MDGVDVMVYTDTTVNFATNPGGTNDYGAAIMIITNWEFFN